MNPGTKPRTALWMVIALLLLFALALGCGDDDDDDDQSDDDDDASDDDDDNDAGDDDDDDDNDDDTLGTATLSPSEVPASSNQRIIIDFTVRTTIQTGGGLRVYFAAAWDFLSTCKMNADPILSCGYVAATTENPDVNLEVTVVYGTPHPGVRLGEANILVSQGVLEPGDTIQVVYGANSGLAYIQEIAHDAEVTILVDSQGDGNFAEIENSPVLTVTPLLAEKLACAVKWNEGRLRVSAVDNFGNHASDYYANATLTLIAEDTTTTPLGQIQIIKGRGNFPLPTVNAGYYVIEAVVPGDKADDLVCRVPYTPGQQQVWYGDPHFHTKVSDSYTAYDPLDSYSYARDVAMLDFTASTDHAECTVFNEIFTQFLTREGIGDSFDEIKRINDLYATNDMVTLLGYEVTIYKLTHPRDGHINVYFRANDGVIYTYLDQVPEVESVDNLDELWAKLDSDGAEAITIPHHTLRADGMGSDFAYYNPAYMRLVEIYSHHGCSESPDCLETLHNPIIDPDALGSVQRAVGELGYRLGFIAGSDNHSGHPAGTGAKDVFYDDKPGGLTGVITDELSRDAIWTAMHNRSVYATSGARIYLDFSINGQGMGSQIVDPAGVVVSARAVTTDYIFKVEIYKYDATNGWQIDFITWPGGLFWHGAATDLEFTESSIYYFKVTQIDGNVAWSSPIWVDLTADKAQPSTRATSIGPAEKPVFGSTARQNLWEEGRWDTLARQLGYLGP